MSQLLQGIASLKDLDPNVINKHYKLEILAKFNEARLSNPRLNAEELARMIGSSSSTLNRMRRDLAIKSPYRYDIPIIQSKKSSTDKSKKEENDKNKDRKKKTESIQLNNKRNRSKTPNKKDIGGTDSIDDEELDRMIQAVNL